MAGGGGGEAKKTSIHWLLGVNIKCCEMTARWNSDNLLTLKRSFPSKVGAICLDAGEPLAAPVSSSR